MDANSHEAGGIFDCACTAAPTLLKPVSASACLRSVTSKQKSSMWGSRLISMMSADCSSV
jgi:hypothetical protein